MIRLLKGKYGEGLSPRWLDENQVPRESDLAVLLERVRIEQTKDKN
jgi:hypothetical protein